MTSQKSGKYVAGRNNAQMELSQKIMQTDRQIQLFASRGAACIQIFKKLSKAIVGVIFLASVAASCTLYSAAPEKVEEQTSIISPHAYVFEHYEKQTYQISMRDGTKLHTEVYAPKNTSKPYPILFVRTPYRTLFHRSDIEGFSACSDRVRGSSKRVIFLSFRMFAAGT